jgi:hypothetical protein
MTLALLFLVGASFLMYMYVYLPSGSCVQVVVSATSRITGKSNIFGSPCAVPFWYKDVRDYNPEPQPFLSMSVGQSAEYQGCIRDWEAAQHGDIRPASFYGTSECVSKLAIKYNDVAMCDLTSTEGPNGLAKSFCVNNFANAKDDLNICVSHSNSQSSLASCIISFALRHDDSALCVSARPYFTDEKAQVDFSDMCYDELAVQQNNSALCEKMINRSTLNTSALCRPVGVGQ